MKTIRARRLRRALGAHRQIDVRVRIAKRVHRVLAPLHLLDVVFEHLAVQDDAAVDVGGRKFRIKINRLIEIGDGAPQVAVAVGENTLRSQESGVDRGGIGS